MRREAAPAPTNTKPRRRPLSEEERAPAGRRPRAGRQGRPRATRERRMASLAEIPRGVQDLGYQVRKGEKAIRIWMPLKPSKKQIAAWRADGADPNEQPRVLFKLGPVFADDQVTAIPGADPAPLRPPISELTGSELDWALAPLSDLAVQLGCTVQIAEMPDGVGGSYRPATGQITLAAGRSVNHRVHTFIHELTHHLAHQDREQHGDGALELSYAQEELVVESVTYTVLMGLGTDPAAYAVPYLAGWSDGDLSIIEQTAERIDRYARVLEDVLDAAPARTAAGAAGEEERAG